MPPAATSELAALKLEPFDPGELSGNIVNTTANQFVVFRTD